MIKIIIEEDKRNKLLKYLKVVDIHSYYPEYDLPYHFEISEIDKYDRKAEEFLNKLRKISSSIKGIDFKNEYSLQFKTEADAYKYLDQAEEIIFSSLDKSTQEIKTIYNELSENFGNEDSKYIKIGKPRNGEIKVQFGSRKYMSYAIKYNGYLIFCVSTDEGYMYYEPDEWEGSDGYKKEFSSFNELKEFVLNRTKKVLDSIKKTIDFIDLCNKILSEKKETYVRIAKRNSRFNYFIQDVVDSIDGINYICNEFNVNEDEANEILNYIYFYIKE